MEVASKRLAMRDQPRSQIWVEGLVFLSLSLIRDTYNPPSLPRLPPLSVTRSVLSYLERRNARPASRLSQADEQPHLDTLIVSLLCAFAVYATETQGSTASVPVIASIHYSMAHRAALIRRDSP